MTGKQAGLWAALAAEQPLQIAGAGRQQKSDEQHHTCAHRRSQNP